MATKRKLPCSRFDVGTDNDITIETIYMANNDKLFVLESKVVTKTNKSTKEKRVEQFKNLIQANLIQINSGIKF
jgi:hypothetical protein